MVVGNRRSCNFPFGGHHSSWENRVVLSEEYNLLPFGTLQKDSSSISEKALGLAISYSLLDNLCICINMKILRVNFPLL